MKQFIMILSCVIMLAVLGGCVEKEKEEERKERDFTICTEDQTPEEVKKIIEEKKESAFQFTYSLQEYMYIVIGYGEQKGGGYSIEVVEFSEDQENVYVNTNLMGSDKVQKEGIKTYPYIVMKCVKPKRNVIFL